MRNQPMNVLEMKARIEREDVAVTIRTSHVAMGGTMPIRVRLPDLVTTSTRPPTRIAVINTRARQNENHNR